MISQNLDQNQSLDHSLYHCEEPLWPLRGFNVTCTFIAWTCKSQSAKTPNLLLSKVIPLNQAWSTWTYTKDTNARTRCHQLQREQDWAKSKCFIWLLFNKKKSEADFLSNSLSGSWWQTAFQHYLGKTKRSEARWLSGLHANLLLLLEL